MNEPGESYHIGRGGAKLSGGSERGGRRSEWGRSDEDDPWMQPPAPLDLRQAE